MPYSIGSGGVAGAIAGRNRQSGRGATPTLEKTKSVSYSATTSDQLFAVSTLASATSKEKMPSAIEVTNSGTVPIFLMVGYSSYTDDTSIDATDYLHVLLPAGDSFNPPVRSVISSNADNTIMFGTAVNNLAPDGNMYTEFSDGVADIDSATAAGIVGNATNTTVYLEPYTSAANCSANLFRVGDLIRVRNEVMEVTAIGDKSDLANNYLTVKRDMHGTDGGTSAVDNDSTRLPFFNAYHDFDKYSVAQTDSNGKFKCFNFFGQGRSATESSGIVAGSFNIKFYQSGYQELGLSGITSSTNSGLTAGETLKLDITVDGGTLFQDLTFTVDSSNVSFGGSNGVIQKIQDALDVQYYTAGNLFEKKVTVGIVNSDIRFTSGSHLSTSAILLADTGDSDTFIDAAANGRIPASGDIPSAVAARLPDDVIYDNVTYATSPNSVFGYDDGYGKITGMCSGSINYETGAIDIAGCPANAEFVVSALTNSAFSGKLNESETNRINSIVEIRVNTPSTKSSGSVTLKTY